MTYHDKQFDGATYLYRPPEQHQMNPRAWLVGLVIAVLLYGCGYAVTSLVILTWR